VVWGVPIIAITVIWNGFVLQPTLSEDTLVVALVAFAIGVPVVFGAIAGSLIRRDGHWSEIVLMAAIGAAFIALTLYEQWINDPRACTPTPDAPCDISLGMSMVLSFAVCYVPFLAGLAAGRGVAAGVVAAIRAIRSR
jgi:hypothetical protein